MTIYEKALASDTDEALDFINYVFSQAHEPHDFRRLCPKMYAEGRHFPDRHFLARENGKIRALVDMWPLNLMLGDEPLKMGLIGNVAVHPYDRGKGHMRKLMWMAIEEAREKGMEMLSLGGRRQRYGYYGFEPGGQKYSFWINKRNIDVCFPDAPADLVFETITQEEDPRLDKAFALYEKQLMHGGRPREDFLLICQGWYGNLYAIMQGETMVGYVVGNIFEIVLEDDALLPAALKSWFHSVSDKDLRLSLAQYEIDRIRMLQAIAEGYSIEVDHKYLVLDPVQVIGKLLRFKKRFACVADGRAVLKVETWPTLAIEVRGDEVTVTETDETPDCTLSYVDGMALLFSTLTAYMPVPTVFHNWFPLSFAVPRADCF